MATILITGATGFIGRHIYRSLLYTDHAVYPTCGRLVDLLDHDQAFLLLRKIKPDYLIANAWMAVPKIFWDHPSNAQWSAATIALIREFYELGGKQCIFVSSTAAEGYLDTPYGRHKKRVEEYLTGFPNGSVVRLGYPKGEMGAMEAARLIVSKIDRSLVKMNYEGYEPVYGAA